jgi:hypothetical protein
MIACSKSSFVFLALTGSLAAIQGCADLHEIDDLGCPCAPGYACRAEDQTCVVPEPPDARPPAPFRCTRTPPECSQGEMDLHDRFGSEAEAKAALVGRWLMCEGEPEPIGEGPSADFIGFEFRADGTLAELRKNSAGECEPHPFVPERVWKFMEFGGEPGAYYVFTKIPGDRVSTGWMPTYSTVPRKVRQLFGGWGTAIADPQ